MICTPKSGQVKKASTIISWGFSRLGVLKDGD